MRLLVAALFLVVISASAQVYRSLGEDGTVVYSDRPTPGAESVDLPPPSSFTPPPMPAFNAPRADAPEDAESNPPFEVYDSFSVASRARMKALDKTPATSRLLSTSNRHYRMGI